jgi:hypothetical protein
MRRLNHIMFILSFIALPVISQPAHAEDASWYQIEVLIFSQQDLFREEKHRMDVQLSYPDNWQYLDDPSSPQNRALNSISSETDAALNTNTSTSSVVGTNKESYAALPQNSLKLGPDNYALKRAPGYKPLYHKAWRQQGLDFKHSPWILIQGGEKFGNHHELEGSIRLVRNRYLHVQANVWKARFSSLAPSLMMETVQPDTATPGISSPENPASEESPSSWPVLPNLPGTEAPISNNSKFQVIDIITLEQSSRISRDEITYLDHPEMGVLVLVSKYEK